MTEEIDGYKDDLDRQVATLRDGLDRVGRTKEDKKTNVRFGREGATMWMGLAALPLHSSAIIIPTFL